MLHYKFINPQPKTSHFSLPFVTSLKGEAIVYNLLFEFCVIQMAERECVKVAVRCRPMSSKEVKENFESIVEVAPDRGEITVHNTKDSGEKERVFSFDLTFEPGCQQERIFKQAALPIIESVLEGYNGTIFAYGQTGTGKTHTMEGQRDSEAHKGIIPRTFEHIINAISGTPGVQFLVKVSMLELYNEEIVDLFSREAGQKLQLHEDKDKGIYVKDLSSEMVTTVEEMNKKLVEGSNNRHVGRTDMNEVSSRSHCIFMIRIEQEQIIKGESKIRAGKLNLVDLAGSERQKKTQATGSRSKEGIYINLALSTLGQVIKALVSSNNGHIPYRDSKLTRLLQQSLGGNAKTIMIANVGPASYNYEQTMSTLRYASQAKKIKNKPKINEDPKDAMIREYQQQIEKLKKMLQGKLPMEGVVVVEKKVKKEKKDIVNRLQKEKDKFQKQKNDILGEDYEKKKELEKKKQLADQLKEEEKLKQEELAMKLKEMKEKLMHGNRVKEEARLNEKKIFEAQKELEERRQQERRLEEELNQKNMDIQNYTEKNLTLKEQVEHRRKQLAKLNNKLKLAYEANNDIQEFMVQEREELQEENRSIVRELKLVNMIIENFVPIHEVAAIQHRLEFDQSFDDWVIVEKNRNPKINPGSALGFKFPLCSEGRFAVACGDDNPRYRQDNILQLDLDQIPPTIEDFRYQISPTVLENLSVVLNDNEQEQRNIAKEERPNVYIDDPQKMNKQQVMRQRENTTRAKSAKKMRPATGKKKK